MQFLLCRKGSHKNIVDAFKCSDENSANSSCHFPKHKSVFLQVLHDSSVSWNITPLYFLRLNILYFAQKGLNKVSIFYTFWCSDQNSPSSCYFWNKKTSFSSNFALLGIMRRNSFILCFALWWVPFLKVI